MGKNSGSSKRSGGKRRMGHIGFQANEIAFIEDEMAAIASEYGLEIDQDVAQHVVARKDAKKARHRKHAPLPPAVAAAKPASKYAPLPVPQRKRIELHALPSRFRHATPLSDVHEHGEIYDILRDVLPDNGALAQCGVPGCNCHHGGREMVLDTRVKQAHTTMEHIDALRAGQCKRCHHGVLQHEIVVRDDASDSKQYSKPHQSNSKPVGKPTGGQRLLSAFYQLIRLARIASTIYTSRVWTKSATDLLQALLTHMKMQFVAGGTHNGNKTQAELEHEQRVVAELSVQLKKAEQATGTSTRDDAPIRLACIYDTMYFQCYYTCIVLYGRACGALPAPETYFSELEQFVPTVQLQFEVFLENELVGATNATNATTLIEALALPMRDSKKPAHMPALLEIFHARLREGVRLFYDQGVGMDGEMDALLINPQLIASAQAAVAAAKSTKKKPQKKHYRRERKADAMVANGTNATNAVVELPAYALLAQWRNNCRDWCCHLFAYATPTSAALDVLAKHAPLVEIGAGTGYWSSLLQAKNVDIVAYDKAPPSADGAIDVSRPGGATFAANVAHAAHAAHTERNAYHGQVPPFCAIGRGGPDVLKQRDMATRTLFLCYPPPHDAMAFECLEHFQGTTVIHVGEWQGDTGDRRFEHALMTRFVLVEELALPNWGNSAYHLSVWQRKRARQATDARMAPLACVTCHKSIDDATSENSDNEAMSENSDDDDACTTNTTLRRCVFCRTHVYCSRACEAKGRVAHRAEHAQRLVFLEDEAALAFDNPLHYAPLVNVAAMEFTDEKEEKIATVQTSWKALTGSGHREQESEVDSEMEDAMDPAHASDDDDDDSDMLDSNDDDDDEESEVHYSDSEEEEDEEAEEETAPVTKLRRVETTTHKTKAPKTKASKPSAAFAFNFQA